MPMSFRPINFLLGLIALIPFAASASYYDVTRNTKEAQQCISYDVRYPYWTKGIYIATYPGNIRSTEGWLSEYYGGIVSDERGSSQLIQYASWQMRGRNAPASGIDFVHAGKHMSWVRSTWEGSSGGIKGKWPNAEFKPNEWYRFVNRAWTPAAPTPHLGYAGIWMKNLATGEWFHLATFKFPAELTGFNNMGGFCEYFSGNASNACAVEFRNAYAMRNGKWGSEAEFSAFNHKADIIKLTQPDDKSSVILETTRTALDPQTRKHVEIPVVTQRVKLTQPETPDFFDAVKISEPLAEGAGNRCVVKWKVDPKASPQLGYTVEIVDGETVIASAAENDPEARQCVIEVAKPKKSMQARLRISDIFGQVSAPVMIPIIAAVPLAACKAPKTTAGLAYRYFESPRQDNWQAIPDFTTLVPKRQGAVAAPDLTPRLNRTGYAFEFTGYLQVPANGLYSFNLISACGAKLILDGKTVIDADGYHSICKTAGAVALKTGLHKLSIPYYQGQRQMLQADDFLQLTWSVPGFADQPVPAAAFCREAAVAEPTIVMKAERQGAGGINLALLSKVSPENVAVERVEYYATNSSFDYYSAQGALGADYLLAESKDLGKATPAVLWGGADNVVRARLVYDKNRTVDSALFMLPKLPAKTPGGDAQSQLQLTQLEHHLYPMAFSEDAGTVTLVGESMGLLTKPLAGDGTFIARLADITPDKPQADGTRLMDENNWYAGIIMRDNLNARPGEPLGGAQIPYAAVMGTANRQTRFCDSTMINGAGNQPGHAGDSNRWFKLERKGADFTLFDSPDGKTWKTIKTVNLPKMSPTLQVGFVIYAIPSATNRIHWARFDNISLVK